MLLTSRAVQTFNYPWNLKLINIPVQLCLVVYRWMCVFLLFLKTTSCVIDPTCCTCSQCWNLHSVGFMMDFKLCFSVLICTPALYNMWKRARGRLLACDSPQRLSLWFILGFAIDLPEYICRLHQQEFRSATMWLILSFLLPILICCSQCFALSQ